MIYKNLELSKQDLVSQWYNEYGNNIDNNVILSSIGDNSRLPKSGSAYHFDGVNSYIDTNTSLAFNQPVTFHVKAKIESTDSIRFVGRSGFGSVSYIIGFDPSGYFQFLAVDSLSNIVGIRGNSQYNSSFFNDGKYHSFTYTHDGSLNQNGFKAYVDGVEITESIPKENDTLNSNLVTNSFVLGINGTQSNSFKLSDFVVIKKSLSLEDSIKLNKYNYSEYSLFIHYKCEDIGLLAIDSSNQGNHGLKINTDIGGANTFHYKGSDVPYSYSNEVGYQKFLKKVSGLSSTIDLSKYHIGVFQTNTSTGLSIVTDKEFRVERIATNLARIAFGGIYAQNLKGVAGNTLRIKFNIKSDITASTSSSRFYGVGNGTQVTMLFNGEEYTATGNVSNYASRPIPTMQANVWNTVEVFAPILGVTTFDTSQPYYWLEFNSYSDGEGVNIKNVEIEYVDGVIPLLDDGSILIDDDAPLIKYEGEVSYPIELVESNCASFEAVDGNYFQSILSNISINDFNTWFDDYEFSCWYKRDSNTVNSTNFDNIFSVANGNMSIGFYGKGFRINHSGTSLISESDGDISFEEINTWHHFKVIKKGNTVIALLDGNKVYSTNLNFNTLNVGIVRIDIGRLHESSFPDIFNGDLAGIEIKSLVDETKYIKIPLSEGDGDYASYIHPGGTNIALSINGAFWNKQDVYHYNYKNKHYRHEPKFPFSYNKGFYVNESSLSNSLRGDFNWNLFVRVKCDLNRLELNDGANQIIQNSTGSTRRWTVNLKNREGGKYIYFYDLFTGSALRSSQEVGEDFFNIEINANNGTSGIITGIVDGVDMISSDSANASAGIVNFTSFTIGTSGLQDQDRSITQSFAGIIENVKVSTNGNLLADFWYDIATDSFYDSTDTYQLTKNIQDVIRTPSNVVIDNSKEIIEVQPYTNKHNGAETKLDYNPYNAPSLSNIPTPQTYTQNIQGVNLTKSGDIKYKNNTATKLEELAKIEGLITENIEPETKDGFDTLNIEIATIKDLADIDILIKEVKIGLGLTLGTKNLSSEIDHFYINANFSLESTTLNWSDSTLDKTINGDILFTPYVGVKSDGSSYYSLPFVNGFGSASFSYGVFLNEVGNFNEFALGATDNLSRGGYIKFDSLNTSRLGRSTNFQSNRSIGKKRSIQTSRLGPLLNADAELYIDGILSNTGTDTSGTVGSTVYELARNASGTPSGFFTANLAFTYYANGVLPSGSRKKIHNAYVKYLVSKNTY